MSQSEKRKKENDAVTVLKHLLVNREEWEYVHTFLDPVWI